MSLLQQNSSTILLAGLWVQCHCFKAQGLEIEDSSLETTHGMFMIKLNAFDMPWPYHHVFEGYGKHKPANIIRTPKTSNNIRRNPPPVRSKQFSAPTIRQLFSMSNSRRKVKNKKPGPGPPYTEYEDRVLIECFRRYKTVSDVVKILKEMFGNKFRTYGYTTVYTRYKIIQRENASLPSIRQISDRNQFLKENPGPNFINYGDEMGDGLDYLFVEKLYDKWMTDGVLETPGILQDRELTESERGLQKWSCLKSNGYMEEGVVSKALTNKK